MVANYLDEVGKPGARSWRSTPGVNSGMDRARVLLSRRSALSATSNLAFPGFVINRALPGAVVAAIAFAVPGLSIENLPSEGDPPDRSAMKRLGAAPGSIEIAPYATLARLERIPSEVRFPASDFPPPAPPSQSNVGLTSTGGKRTRAEPGTPREGAISSAPAIVLQPSISRSDIPELVTLRAAEPTPLRGRPEVLPDASGAAEVQDPSLQSAPQLGQGDRSPTIALASSELSGTAVQDQSAVSDNLSGLRDADAVGTLDLAPETALELTRAGSSPAGPEGDLVAGAQNGSAASSLANALVSSERALTRDPGADDVSGPANLATRNTLAAPVGNLDGGSEAKIELAASAGQSPVGQADGGASQVQPGLRETVSLARRAEMSSQLARSADRAAEVAETRNPIPATLEDNARAEAAFAPRLKSRSFVAGKGINGASAVAITSRLATRIDGRVAGELDFQQDMQTIKIRIGSIVELLKDRYETAELDRIARSASGDVYLSISQLQQAGIPISYDPVYDELAFGSKDYLPRAAHKVQVDQITTPQRDLGPIVMEQVTGR